MTPERKRALRVLVDGQPPPAQFADALLGGYDGLLKRWQSDLEGYVVAGGSLLRIVSAQPGGGKTHLGRAFQSMAARAGFLVCQVDAQSSLTDDDLFLYRSVCQGLRLPAAFLEEDSQQGGLLSILQHAAAQPQRKEIRAWIASARVPMPALQHGILQIFDALAQGRFTNSGRAEDEDFRTLCAFLVGEKPRKPLAAMRTPGSPLRALKRVPGKRDASLWLQSLLLLCRPLGFSGIVLVLDEHDEVQAKRMDKHIAQLRRTLDRLAEGRLPGVFALYLVLDTFSERIRSEHEALHQRVTPLAEPPPSQGLLTLLGAMRDAEDAEAFIQQVGDRVFRFAFPAVPEMSPALASYLKKVSEKYISLGHVDTRSIVKLFAREILRAT